MQSTLDDIRREVRNIVQSTPEGLDTPTYTVIKKTDFYEIRNYSSYSVCSVGNNNNDDTLSSSSSSSSSSTSSTTTDNSNNDKDPFLSNNNFNKLAGYIFGDNNDSRKMSMTTPVIMKDDVMEFVLPSYLDSRNAPSPKDSNIVIKDIQSEIVAVKEFSGLCTEAEISKQMYYHHYYNHHYYYKYHYYNHHYNHHFIIL